MHQKLCFCKCFRCNAAQNLPLFHLTTISTKRPKKMMIFFVYWENQTHRRPFQGEPPCVSSPYRLFADWFAFSSQQLPQPRFQGLLRFKNGGRKKPQTRLPKYSKNLPLCPGLHASIVKQILHI